ncbi:25200_t:CDS:2, partial [Gigaspora margarita]
MNDEYREIFDDFNLIDSIYDDSINSAHVCYIRELKELITKWRRGKLSEEITGPFELGKFHEIEKHAKNRAHPLEVFKHNAEK